MSIRSVNPTTGDVFAEYPYMDSETIDQTLTRAWETYESWKQTDFDERTRLMHKAAHILRDRVEEYARLMVKEMGKPIEQARGEVRKCAWACEYFSDNAREFLQNEEMQSDGSRAFVRFDPLGPIFAVMPWNFPFWQVIRFAAPNLMAGNVGVLKHSHNVGGCAVALQELFEEAGFPEGAFQSIFLSNDMTDEVVGHTAIRGVTLTGSVGAGRAVAKLAGQNLKPTVLELGGSDPFIVLDDCNLDYTVEQAVRGRLINNGQSCIAAKRFIVEEGIYNDFVEKFRDALAGQTMGDPMDDATDLGPMARLDLRTTLHKQVQRSVDQGAKLVLGGEIPEREGFYYPATLVTECEYDMPVFDEETFGPVAAVTRVQDADEAIDVANHSHFGLGASVWTSTDRGVDLAARIEAGHVSVNGIVKSDPRLPFGGVKDSGYGRELSHHGIHEFVNKKTVWVK
ncbi:NAD-dependent succinate-semialdehyde dehydrogenase [Persicimonas caeni]|uniref:NAD-dependent succinate-semialdehyde dehydrogenase n=1 Tax=Persicimonas caeni TaxID=2292766 RepID=A0A4Y6PSE0_PERCE|nr:NAD-dependent succinate-semialdehyde dehydrogenase [Persicimonas caeni]QDG50927.1 NAD-dependent succinate-semialdehyde dehydrogenase [Persicimonas caeni]QED32148.1 NAD-dependent succinate-semialdehyde dehydrogenase [Persicimonas caeni]